MKYEYVAPGHQVPHLCWQPPQGCYTIPYLLEPHLSPSAAMLWYVTEWQITTVIPLCSRTRLDASYDHLPVLRALVMIYNKEDEL